jgi:beta-lactamase superfamily II metal-dependent hydrolase
MSCTSFRGQFLAFLGIVGALSAATTTRSQGLEIFFIDVQGGAATLIVTPARESVLIDTGWPGLEDRDPKRIEHIVKDIARLEQIDHLVTTHWHTDHYGGVEGLSKRVRIGRFWDRGLPDTAAPDNDRTHYPDGPKPGDPLGEAYRRISAGNRQALRAGDRLPLKGGVEAVVLASGGEVIASAGPANPACADTPPDLAPDPSDNARSLALRFRLGKFDFLDCGDLTWNVEKKLVCPTDRIGPIDLYQVTHHGMAISNHPTLVKTIAPRVSIMNNGPKKGGDAACVSLLKSLPGEHTLYQLHKNASTTADQNTDPSRIANADPSGGRFIRATVAPDGSEFEVRIDSDGPATSFRSR